jgi:aspartate racemase
MIAHHTDPNTVRAWVNEQRLGWRDRSLSLGMRAADQLHPSVTLHYVPPQVRGNPLLLLGGMGPMAGLDGFDLALSLDPWREIVLHQACNIPCRTYAIQIEARGDGRAAETVVTLLHAEIDYLVSQVKARAANLIVLCNTVHHFLPRLLQHLPPEISFHPLPSAAMTAASRLAPRRLMLLTTEGTRFSGFYSRAAEKAKLNWCEPNEEERYLLQHAIFKGIKGYGSDSLLMNGDNLIECLAHRNEPVDALLAGCTEIPLLFAALREQGNAYTRAYLNQITVIDPVFETLNALC